MTDSEIREFILSRDEEELMLLYGIIRELLLEKRAERSQRIKDSLKVGDKVLMMGKKEVRQGRIVKLNLKTAHIWDHVCTYSCPYTILEKVDND